MSSSPADHLDATIQAGPASSWTGTLGELSLKGASVAFGEGAPTLPMGAEVVLVLEGQRLARPFHLEAEVVARHELPDEQRRYGLAFFEPHKVARVLEIVFQRLFDRRSSARVPPRHEGELRANLRVCPRSTWWSCHVLNLSTHGMGLTARVPADGDLSRTEAVEVHLRLPEAGDLVFTGTLRSRRLVSDALVYGVALDHHQEANALEALDAYVQRRRAELAAVEADEERTLS